MNNTETKPKIAYSVVEASEAVSMCKSYIRNEIRAKKLQAKLVGNRVVILKTDLENWLNEKPDWQGIEERKKENA